MALATSLLPKLPQRILEQTGLGDVIEEAIMPITTYLPSLTPTDESVLLLRAAYEALFTLLHARFSGKATDPKRAKMLDKMLRKGVIYAYHHCPENLTIVFPLLDVMGDVIKKMGVQAIKHLKVRFTQYTLIERAVLTMAGRPTHSLHHPYGPLRTCQSSNFSSSYQDNADSHRDLLDHPRRRSPSA